MYHRIMVPVDGSATSGRGLDEAIKLAQLIGASLRLVHVIEAMKFVTGFEPAVVYLDDALPAMKRAAEKFLEEAKARAAAAGVTADTCMIQSLGPCVCELAIDQAKACKGRSDRDRHAWPARRGPPDAGQRRGADRAPSAGPRAARQGVRGRRQGCNAGVIASSCGS